MKPLTGENKKGDNESENKKMKKPKADTDLKQAKIDAEGQGMSIEKVGQEEDPKKLKSSIGAIFDLSVLRIPAMTLLSIANIFGMTGYYIPYVYIAGYAEENIYGKPTVVVMNVNINLIDN